MMTYHPGRILLFIGALIAAVGFVLLPWVFNQSGLQIAINYLSDGMRMDGIMLWVAAIAIVGMFFSLFEPRLRTSPLVLLFAIIVYYFTLSQMNDLFRAGGLNLLKEGFWVVVFGSILNMAGALLFKRYA